MRFGGGVGCRNKWNGKGRPLGDDRVLRSEGSKGVVKQISGAQRACIKALRQDHDWWFKEQGGEQHDWSDASDGEIVDRKGGHQGR